jgi:hypothetical protein
LLADDVELDVVLFSTIVVDAGVFASVSGETLVQMEVVALTALWAEPPDRTDIYIEHLDFRVRCARGCEGTFRRVHCPYPYLASMVPD